MMYGGSERTTGQLHRHGVPIVEVPELPVGVPGEAVGDLAVVDGEAMKWNGRKWEPSTWQVYED